MLKKVISDESGRTLAWTLIIMAIGVLLIPTFLSHASTNLFATRASEEGLKELYAADSGVEYVLLQLKNGITQGSHSYTINDRSVVVTWGEHITETYKITSTATSQIDGGSTAIESYIGEITMIRSVFNYAAAALGSDDKECDIDFGGNSELTSDVELGGDVYANGNVCVSGNAEVDGDATATGNITITGNAEIKGEQTKGAPSLVAPDIDTAGYKTEAMNVECAVCGDITHSGDWEPPPGDYQNPEHVQNNLKIKDGTWIFRDTVCAGIDTNKDLIIEGNTTVTFEGPVKVGRYLDIKGNSTVIFRDTVCVEGELKISGNTTVTFDGAIKVEGDLNLEGNDPIEFGDTVYVGGALRISGNKAVELGGTVYVCGDIKMSGNSDELVGGEAVVAEGDIELTGNSDFNEAAEDIPFVVSTDGNITTLGNGDIAAILYAPNGDAYLSGNSDVYGAVVGLSVTGLGNLKLVYPSDLMDARDLPADVLGLEVRTYHIYP